MDTLEEQRVFSSDELECSGVNQFSLMDFNVNGNEPQRDICMKFGGATATIDHSKVPLSQDLINAPKAKIMPEMPVLTREANSITSKSRFVTKPLKGKYFSNIQLAFT